MNFLMPIELHARHSAFSLLLTVAFMTLIFPLATPQIALSADVVVGGQVEVLEPGVVEVGGEETHDIGDLLPGDAGDLPDPVMDDGYDLELVIPVEIENLYPNVDLGELLCQINKVSDADENYSSIVEAYEIREFDIENGAYSNTFNFLFFIPPDVVSGGEYHYEYVCDIRLKDSESGDIFHRVFYRDPDDENQANYPLWTLLSDQSRLHASGILE